MKLRLSVTAAVLLLAGALSAGCTPPPAPPDCDAPAAPGVNWSGCNFRIDSPDGGLNLAAANLTGANLTGADLRLVYLADANLSGADLRGSDLRGTEFAGANLTGANLSGAQIGRDYYDEGLIRFTSMFHASLRNADLSYLAFDDPEMDLRGANLSGANLRGTDLSDTWTTLLGDNVWGPNICPDGVYLPANSTITCVDGHLAP